VELADEVLAVAERTDELLVLADTLVTKGSAMLYIGRRREGQGVIEVGGRIAEANGLTFVQLRASNNGLMNQSEFDPRGAWDAGSAGLALARRLGQRSWVHSFAGTLGFIALRTGDWDAGETALELTLADTSDPLDRLLQINNLVNLHVIRGKPYADEMSELEATTAAHPDGPHTLYVPESRGWIAFAAGRLNDARSIFRDLAATNMATSAGVLEWCAHLSIWLGDPNGAEQDLAGFWSVLPHVGAVEATRDVIQAGITGLRGERAVALIGYREVAARLAESRLPFDEALLAIGMAYVLGPSEPFVADAIARTRAAMTSLGAPPLLDLLDAAISHGPHLPSSGRDASVATGAESALSRRP